MLNPTLQKLLRKLKRDRGFDFTGYKEDSIARRIANRMQARGVDSYREYMWLLNSETEEYDRLFNALTINVTEWFRDPDVWQALREEVIPRILRAKEETSRTANRLNIFRVWCAGCATGEEAYSLAMILHELTQKSPLKWHVSIYATDIDPQVLAHARRGEYQRKDMNGLPCEYLSEHFTCSGDTYTVKPSLSRCVRFKEHNFLEEEPIRYPDLILCRNVLIYFDHDLQRNVYELFHSALKTNGFLVLGKAERPMGRHAKLFPAVDQKLRIYRKAAE